MGAGRAAGADGGDAEGTLTEPGAAVAAAHDDGVRLDRDGRQYVVEPTFDPPAGARGSRAEAGPTPYPLDQTFTLHSNPGSTHVIYIDVDGQEVAGTAWNGGGLPAGDYPAWSLDGDPTTFDDDERAAVQSIWQRVAEDYAPFDVDVTTEDPGAAAIERTDLADDHFGARALVSPSDLAVDRTCGNPCGGVAYVGVFDHIDPNGAPYQPAWVYPSGSATTPRRSPRRSATRSATTSDCPTTGRATTAAPGSGRRSWAQLRQPGEPVERRRVRRARTTTRTTSRSSPPTAHRCVPTPSVTRPTRAAGRTAPS